MEQQKKLSVLIDIRSIDNVSGLGRYTNEVVLPVAEKLKKKYEVFLLTNRKISSSDIETIIIKGRPLSFREQWDFYFQIKRSFNLYWFPTLSRPLFFNYKSVTSVHDIVQLKYYEKNLKTILRNCLIFIFLWKINRSSKSIIFNSAFTKNEFNRLFSNKKRVDSIIKLNTYFPERYYKRVGEKNNFLFLGNNKVNKNLKMLIDVFTKLDTGILYIVGNIRNHRFTDHNSDYLNTNQNGKIKIVGVVGQKELEKYLIKADALIFPSLYEGWGLPIYEALAFGANIIFSNIRPLNENIYYKKFSFDPNSSLSLYNRLVAYKNLTERQKQHVYNSTLDKLKKRTWSNVIEETEIALTKNIKM